MFRWRAFGLTVMFSIIATGCGANMHDVSPNTVATDESADDEIECRTVLRLGSNVPRRLCGTPEQWEQYERTTRSEVQEWFRRMSTNAIPPS